MASVKVATYDEIKNLPNHPEKLLIDVRGAHELEEKGKIPISINIPITILEEELKLDEMEFKAKYQRDKPKINNEIIFHCSKGGRGGKAANLAIELGFLNVKNYVGGWNEWVEKENL